MSEYLNPDDAQAASDEPVSTAPINPDDLQAAAEALALEMYVNGPEHDC